MVPCPYHLIFDACDENSSPYKKFPHWWAMLRIFHQYVNIIERSIVNLVFVEDCHVDHEPRSHSPIVLISGFSFVMTRLGLTSDSTTTLYMAFLSDFGNQLNQWIDKYISTFSTAQPKRRPGNTTSPSRWRSKFSMNLLLSYTKSVLKAIAVETDVTCSDSIDWLFDWVGRNIYLDLSSLTWKQDQHPYPVMDVGEGLTARSFIQDFIPVIIECMASR